jgi:hypothetical protein
MTRHQTDPIPVFPRADGIDTSTRTPMAQAILWATEKTVGDDDALRSLAPNLGPEIARELVTARIEDFLDVYARGIQDAARDLWQEIALGRIKPAGLLAVWHGTDFMIRSDFDVEPGYLVERRCDCRQVAAKQRAAAAFN